MKCTSQAPTRQRLEGVRRSAHCVEAGGEDGACRQVHLCGLGLHWRGLGLYSSLLPMRDRCRIHASPTET